MSTTGRPSRIGFLTAIGGLALVLAACSSSGGSTAPSAAAPSVAAPSAAAPSAAGSAAAAGGETYTVAVATGSWLVQRDSTTSLVPSPRSGSRGARLLPRLPRETSRAASGGRCAPI